MVPPVRATHDMVAAANNFEVEAGYRILTQGGNAVDAGVASVLAASVTELSRFGLGGEMPLLIKMSGQPTIAISGVGVAPAKATVEFYRHRSPEAVGRAQQHAAGSRAGHSLRDYAGRVRRPDSGARKVRNQVLRPGGAARHRVCRRRISHARRVRRHAAQLPAHHRALAGFNEILLSRRRSPRRAARSSANPLWPKTFRELATAEKKAHGNRQAKLRAVRDLFYKGSIAHRIAAFLGEQWRPDRL